MSNLIPPHGGKGLTCALLEGAELEAEKTKAAGLKKIEVSPKITLGSRWLWSRRRSALPGLLRC